MQRIDLRKELKHLYSTSVKEVVEVDVPTFRFLMIDGQGDPNTSSEYAEAVEALFSVSYATKFKVKNELKLCDYAVMPLEGLWWADDMSAFFTADRASWKWTMMIMQPRLRRSRGHRGSHDGDQAEEEARRHRPAPAGRIHGGPCRPSSPCGPFSEEGPTIERLHAYIRV